MAKRFFTYTLLPLIWLAIGLGVGWFAAHQLATPDATADSLPARLQLGERHRGEITSASELNGKDGSRFERLTLVLDEGALVEVTLGGALKGSLALYDEEQQLVAATDETSPEAPIRLRERLAEGGEYLLVVGGRDAHSYGPYTLESKPLEAQDSGSLEVPSAIVGWLQEASNEYTFEIERSGLYVIEMRSDDFDAYLTLSGPDGLSLSDDDSAGNLDARISHYLEAGEYRVAASAAYGQGRGFYTLDVMERALPDDTELQNGGELEPGQSLHGWFDGENVEYRLELRDTALVTLDLLSDEFDAYLELHGERVSLSDDDSGGNLNARLQSVLSPGTYRVVARSYGGGGSGLFTLRAEAGDVGTAAEDGEIVPGERIAGRLSTGTRDFYHFRVEEAGEYRIEMSSSEIDAYLELEGDGVYLTDDDGGEGLDARLQVHLEPGEYRIVARAFNATDAGSYVLSVVAQTPQ